MSEKHPPKRPPIRVTDRRQATPGDGAPVETPDASIDAQALADDRLEQLKRLKADFENYRTRVIREQTELVERASLRIVERLLPVLDDLERALQAVRTHEPDERSSSGAPGVRGAQPPRSDEAIVRGVELVYKHLHDVLVDEGLERVQSEGAFDPQQHEAVSSVPGDVREPTVLEVVRPGYKLKGKTIRPALVHVSVPEQSQEGGK